MGYEAKKRYIDAQSANIQSQAKCAQEETGIRSVVVKEIEL
jgi:hypothetical protein